MLLCSSSADMELVRARCCGTVNCCPYLLKAIFVGETNLADAAYESVHILHVCTTADALAAMEEETDRNVTPTREDNIVLEQAAGPGFKKTEETLDNGIC